MTAEVRVVMDLPEETTKPHRHWYRLNLLTWLVTVVVAVALVCRQIEKQNEFAFGGLGRTTHSFDTGWPLTHREFTESYVPFNWTSKESSSHWHLGRLIANCAVCCLLIVSTMVVSERWLRQRSRLQLSLRSLMLLAWVVGAMVMLLNAEWELPFRDFSDAWVYWSIISWLDFAVPARWPILFAVGCSIYLAGELIWHLVAYAWNGAARLRANDE
jgi:hypothetical protein